MTREQPIVGEWLAFKDGVAADEARLFAFPHAGGGASTFLRLRNTAPAGIGVYPIRLPGRESRILEPAVRDPDQLLRELESVISAYADRPYALLGYCSGALLAVALENRARVAGLAPPKLVVVAAASPPSADEVREAIQDLPLAGLIDRLRQFGATPEEILENHDWMRMLEPSIRADFEILHRLDIGKLCPVRAPLVAMATNSDPEVSPAGMAGWIDYTLNGFSVRVVEGDDFSPSSASFTGIVFEEMRRFGLSGGS